MAANSAPFSRLRTNGFAGYNVAWSPFYPDKLAVAGSANVSSDLISPKHSLNIDFSCFSMAWLEMGD